jgi:hypothetical protein
MKRVVLIALFGFACSAHADTYRCTSPEGKVSYQEKPCPAGSEARKVEIKDTSLSNDAQGDAKRKEADLARLHQAFQARLNAGDIDGARALASNEVEFALVREAEKQRQKAAKERAVDRAQECRDLAAEIERLHQAAALNPDNLAAKHQANEAESRLASECH